MPGYLVEMLLKGLYLPEIYRRFSAIQQNTIFIESIARCGKGNTQQNLRQNVQPNIQQTHKENNKRKFKFKINVSKWQQKLLLLCPLKKKKTDLRKFRATRQNANKSDRFVLLISKPYQQ